MEHKVDRGRSNRSLPATPSSVRAPGSSISTTAATLLSLQRSAGNRATSGLVQQVQQGPSGVTPVQRLLDQKYQPASMKSAGLKPGKTLFGKTDFAKLVDSLGAYFLAGTTVGQYRALAKVEERVTGYQSSKSRNQTRKGAAKTREDTKQRFVQQLSTDVQKEKEALDASPTGDLLDAHKDASPETAVLVVGQNLARDLGLGGVDQILGLSADELRKQFIKEVYLPQYMAERSGQKRTGLSMAEQLDQIRSVNRIDPATLPRDSRALRLFSLLEQADLGKSVRTLSDPKFGGDKVEDFVPAVKGWDQTKSLAIKGGDDYRAKVKAMVAEIALTPVGAQLLRGIGGVSRAEGESEQNVHPETKTQIAKINPPTLANVNFKDSRTGQYMYANSAGKGAATVDAFNDVIGADPGKVKDEPFRKRDAVVGLFHELVHVYLGEVNEEPFKSSEDPSETMKCGLMYEPRVAGIRIQETRNGKTLTFPFDQEDFNPVSENTFRRQYAELKGEDEYYVRPYYLATDKSEVQGPTTKQKVARQK